MAGALVSLRAARCLLACVALAFVALPAGSALGATTIGQTGGNSFCSPDGGTDAADTNYVVPTGGGTITSFSFQSVAANAGNQLDFLVLRPTSGSNYTVVGKTGLVTLAGTGLETFSAPDISAEAGDIIGWWSNAAVIPNCLRMAAGGATINNGPGGFSDPNVNDTLSIPFQNPGLDLNESAMLLTTPPNKDACKDGGWQNYTDGQGQPFKNQGQCVAWTNHNT
jgi:hypothetical protein